MIRRPAAALTTALASILVLLVAFLAPASAAPSDDPFAGKALYVQPDSLAKTALSVFPQDSSAISTIANTAQAFWVGDWNSTSTVASTVRTYVRGAARANAYPVLTLYAIPDRDCGGYSAGGFSTAAQYDAWIDQVVAGIAGYPTAVVVEPDAVTGTSCLDSQGLSDRAAMLKYAVDQLTSQSSTAVYIDGGHSRWLSASELAYRLKYVDVDRARGFALNVSNFYTTSEEIAYGEQVSALLGGKSYVIDTSRNGSGPDADQNWCNPDGRSLGASPTADTAGAHADAYLWIKHPGESDGTCGTNDPKSGTWFQSYALALAAN